MIATLASRRDLLGRLLGRLLPQAEADGRVEVLGCWDNGEHPLPAKRQALLAAATGVYVSFADDDDEVDPEFVPAVVAAMAGRPDFVAFDHAYYVDGALNARVVTGLQHPAPGPGPGGELIRPVTHINPVLRSLTGGVTFGGHAPGEDGTYVMQVWRRLRTQANAGDGRPLYHYRYRTYDSVQRALAPHDGRPRLDVESPCFSWIEMP
jgi:glycosyl transferase family 2